ncbi:MAG: hypothetical protein AABM67_16855 [Acidobacteriota bacterium]
MYKIAVVILAVLSMGLVMSGECGHLAHSQATMSPTGQGELLDQLSGKWVFEASVLGNGFLGSTFPGATTPPKEIVRAGQKVTFSARLQTDQGSYGQPVMEDFNFLLEKGTGQDYLITVESKSWLNLKQLKLVGEASGLKGATKIPFDGSEASLAVAIEVTLTSGHTWDFTVSDSNGKPQRWFKLTFKPTQSASSPKP